MIESELKDYCEKIAITIEEIRLKIPENTKQKWATAIYTNAHNLHYLNHLPSIRDEQGDSLQRPGCKHP